MQMMKIVLSLSLFGVVLWSFQPTSNAEMMKKDHMMDEKSDSMSQMKGMLVGAEGHNAAGAVRIEKNMKGQTILLIMDMKVDRVPDGRVYLAKNGDYKKGIELGKLKKFSGMVKFSLPADIDPSVYDGVVIWCKKFDVEIGHATFEMAMMK